MKKKTLLTNFHYLRVGYFFGGVVVAVARVRSAILARRTVRMKAGRMPEKARMIWVVVGWDWPLEKRRENSVREPR